MSFNAGSAGSEDLTIGGEAKARDAKSSEDGRESFILIMSLDRPGHQGRAK
jgi:hypothetical protein